jgi:chemotaxis protein methyltransferase CheR
MPINPKDFDYIRHLVRARSAIVLDPGKEALVESRLSLLARREGYESIEDLLQRLHAQTDGKLQTQVVEAMTTNETLFFRDIHPFEMMRYMILPDLLKKREVEKRLNIWSAGCSSGQEIYSLAILLKEHFTQYLNWNIRLIASDISAEMIARAKEGRFSQFEVNRGLPAALLVKYFHQKGIDWQVREDVRRMVEFIPMNLAEDWPPTPIMDVIFMRNVLIYFDVETKKKILARARALLRPDGYLFLGTAETTLNLDDNFDRIQNEKAWCYKAKKK